jgi:hypothetical protein
MRPSIRSFRESFLAKILEDQRKAKFHSLGDGGPSHQDDASSRPVYKQTFHKYL